MSSSRRDFVTATLASLAAVCVARAGRAAEAVHAQAGEDGYRLWLRYAPPGPEAVQSYRAALRQLVIEGSSPTASVIRDEMVPAVRSMIGVTLPARRQVDADGALVIGTPERSSAIRDLRLDAELTPLGPEGFVMREGRLGDRQVIAIASSGETGALYGAYAFLRLMQTGRPIAGLRIAEKPRLQLRLLNHWDNLDGSIERGYAGRSLWRWNELPDRIDPRYVDYARANASIGINGTVINSVNANPLSLSSEYLRKAAALADVWRPYGIRLQLSANFAAPVRLGGLPTADPLDGRVVDWWKAKADEIYKLIPDFGGFTVKANSEGQPGPKDYGRSHAEGANAIAEALAPHGGHVIWRAFIYDEEVDRDRAKRAYIEFTRLDGRFHPNVVVQVKNGPLDFQPREPFHPLFGALEHTPVIAEIQATQEYLGQAKHLVYHGTMWKEFLDADTHAKGTGSTVGRVLEGAVRPQRVTGMASVVNPGTDTNWCGHHFSQANWYASGRLAWDHEISAAQIAEEWTRMTFTNDPRTLETIHRMMMGSHEIFVNYTMPLGLHHLIGGDHYAPMPENAEARQEDWTAVYYHQASIEGIGFDRTMGGTQAVAQYFPPVCAVFDDAVACPETLLLWFHRVGWDHRMKSGRTLWAEMCAKYHQGARQAADLERTWASLAGGIDPRRHREVAERLAIQTAHAADWRDHILRYFHGFSRRAIVTE